MKIKTWTANYIKVIILQFPSIKFNCNQLISYIQVKEFMKQDGDTIFKVIIRF